MDVLKKLDRISARDVNYRTVFGSGWLAMNWVSTARCGWTFTLHYV